MTAPFTATEALSDGWARRRQHFVSLFLPLGVLTAGLTILEGSAQQHGQGLLHLVLQALGAVVTMGWWRIALRVHDGEPVGLGALGEVEIGSFIRYVITILLFWILVLVGLALLVVPGLFVAARFCLAPAIVVDEGLDPVAALRRSHALTEGRVAEIWVFALYALALNLVGALALGIGLLWTVPTTYLGAVHVYRRLAASPPASARPLVPLAA